jgi:PAS domain S-box-containing protein
VIVSKGMQRSPEHRLLVERSALLDSAADGIYAIDPAGLCTFINRAASDMLGYTPDECIGRNIHDLVHNRHPDGSPYLVAECPIYRTVATGQGARVENEVAWHKTGRAVPVAYSAQPIVIDGAVEGAVVTMRDVTQDREAKQALASSERRLRLALTAGRMGTWLWHARTGAVQWDAALELLYGLQPGTFSGTYEAFLLLVHSEDRARVVEEIAKAGQDAPDYEIEFRTVWPSGEVRWISDRGQVLSDEGGRIGITGVCWDSTDRKRAEQELETSRGQVVSILASITDGFAAYDRAWRFTYVNPEGARLLHHTPEELLGKVLWELYPDVLNTPLYTEAHRAVRDQVSVELEQYSTRFGLWWSLRIFPSTDGAAIYYQDITARKRMERRRLAQYSVSRILASAVDVEEALHKLLEAAATHLGYSSGRVAPSPSLTVPAVTWQDPPLDPSLAKHVLQTGEPQSTATAFAFPILAGGKVLGAVEFHHTEPTAPEPELMLTATVLGNQIGQFLQRKQAERELRDSEARNRAVLQTALDSIVTIDSQSRVLEFNPAAEQTFGHARADVLGRHLPDLIIPPAFREAHRAGMSRYLATGIGPVLGNRIEVTALHADGREFPIELAINRIPSEGAPLFTAYARDITQRTQHEKALKEAKASSEAANQAKSQFLASMSHELRTPLNAIIGYSEMLQEEVDEAGVAHLKPDLQKIHSAGKHLLELINEVLDLSKIEAGRMELYEEDFDVTGAIREIAGTVLPLVQKNGNHLDVHCAPDLGLMHADLTKFRQSVLNLLSNASKFTENGKITITASRHTEGPASRIRVQVSDTGIGIPPEKIEQLFEPFSQADASTSRNYGGTGLGLALSRRFSRLMGGDLTAHSEQGRGSTFVIEIPAEGAPVKETTPAPIAEMEIGAILVVDDDPTARDLIQRSLDKEGFHTVGAATGPEALRLARKLQPRAITLDVMMPGMDGWAVLGQLKADPETCDIPVIMVTMLEDRNLGYSLGATDYLTKPIDRERLAHVLRKHHCPHPPCSILVVEDDRSSRELLTGMLQRGQWTVIAAEDGAAALARLSEVRPALILLDLMMPRMDGFEVVAALKKNPDWCNIPVVVITAKDITEEERRRLNGQVERILSKGALDSDGLLAEVRRVVSHAPAAARAGTGQSPHPAIPE